MQKRAIQILAWAVLLAAIPCGIQAYSRIRSKDEAGAFMPNDRWSGVLRVWAAPDLPGGGRGLISWLNGRAEAFERRNEGIRVQIIEIEPELLAEFASASNPPDAIIFPAGLFEGPDNLIPLETECEYLPGLSEIGRIEGARYAIPVAMGAYFWIVNADRMDCSPGEKACPEGYILQAPNDTEARSWSAATLALFAGTSEGVAERVVLPGADLGLPAAEDEISIAGQEGEPLRPPSKLPEDFRSAESVYAKFTAKEADAICATQTDLKRLETLADSGRAPDYAVFSGGLAFTDQIALAAVPNVPRERGEERRTLAGAFLAALLSEDSQAALASAYAFRTTKGPALYASYRAGMATAEASLANGVIAAPAFGDGWREDAKRAADRYFSAGGNPEALLMEALG